MLVRIRLDPHHPVAVHEALTTPLHVRVGDHGLIGGHEDHLVDVTLASSPQQRRINEELVRGRLLEPPKETTILIVESRILCLVADAFLDPAAEADTRGEDAWDGGLESNHLGVVVGTNEIGSPADTEFMVGARTEEDMLI